MKTIIILLATAGFIYISVRIILHRIKIGRNFKTKEQKQFLLKNPSFTPWAGNKYFILILVAIWLISLLLPGITDPEHSSPTLGIYILVIGALGPLQGILSWYANPCAFFAIRYLLKNKYKEAMFFSIASILLGLQALMFQGSNISYVDSDGPFGTLASGYYLWMLFLILLFLLCLFNYRRIKNILSS